MSERTRSLSLDLHSQDLNEHARQIIRDTSALREFTKQQSLRLPDLLFEALLKNILEFTRKAQEKPSAEEITHRVIEANRARTYQQPGRSRTGGNISTGTSDRRQSQPRTTNLSTSGTPRNARHSVRWVNYNLSRQPLRRKRHKTTKTTAVAPSMDKIQIWTPEDGEIFMNTRIDLRRAIEDSESGRGLAEHHVA